MISGLLYTHHTPYGALNTGIKVHMANMGVKTIYFPYAVMYVFAQATLSWGAIEVIYIAAGVVIESNQQPEQKYNKLGERACCACGRP